MTGVRAVSRVLERLAVGDSRAADPAQRVVLMYHGVEDRPGFNTVSAEALRAQLEYASRHYLVVRVVQLIESVVNRWTTDLPLLAVTFDDAYENFLTSAYPILREFKMPVGLAIPTGHVGRMNQWDIDKGFPPLPLMSWEQMRELDPSLVDFGSHSVTHRSLATLNADEVRHEVRASKREIEQRLGSPSRWFAYPYGKRADLHPAAADILEEVGYLGACSTRWGRFNGTEDRFRLRRIDVWPDDTLADFTAKLRGYYDWLAPKEDVAFTLRGRAGGRRA